MKTYNLLIAINDKYIEQTKCLLYSLKKYNKVSFDVYLIYENITETNIKALDHFIKINNIGRLLPYKFNSENILLPIVIEHITKETYFRLYAPFIIEENIDRLLYLDCDMICTGSIKDLYECDFEGNTLVGIPHMITEKSIKWNKEHNIDLDVDGKTYINAGVLLINIEKYKELTTPTKINNYIKKNKDTLKYQDQDVINRMFKNKIKYLDNKFNYQIFVAEFDKMRYEGNSLIHYASPLKPWLNDYDNTIFQEKYISLYNEMKEKEYSIDTIDIIIPVYNSRKTLPKTLASIETQKNLSGVSIYVIDDCSNEKYDDIIEYYKQYLDIYYYRLDKKSNFGVARNLGMKKSKGKYITFIDSGNVLYNSNSLNTLLTGALEVDVLRTDVIEEQLIGVKRYTPLNTSLHGKVYKRSFIDDNELEFSDTSSKEDIGFNITTDLLGATYNDIYEATYIKCNNDNGVTANKYNQDEEMINYAKNIASAIEHVNKRIKNKLALGIKALNYMRDIYYISQNASNTKTYVEVGEYNKKIFNVIKASKLKDEYIRMAITDENFYNYYMDINNNF